METYAPKMSKFLMTPDPHYVPGYAGYCPQLKFNMGRSYGQLTAELLTSPEVKHSSRLVLHTGRVPSTERDTDLTRRSSPDSNMKTIPGYTGFIPKSRNYFACSYSETCRKALTEFYQDRRVRIWQQSTCQDLPAVVDHANLPLERPKPPLTPKSKKFSYKPLKPFTMVGNPYFIEDDDDLDKNFISGFTGHVPKARFLFGKGYPITAKQALAQFRKQQQSEAMAQSTSGRIGSTTASMPTIYPPNRGVVPSFMGHIPGYKFMYGSTFGQLSHNALEKSGIQRILQEQS